MSILNSGPLATLLTRLTAARAAFLDVAISSRAPSSTALTDSKWTDARATKLDNLDATISSVKTLPPTTSGLKGIPTANADIGTVNPNLTEYAANAALVSASSSSYNTWKTILNITSSVGIIEFMPVFQVANTSNLNAQFRFKIDGNIIYTSDTNLWNDATDNRNGVSVVGAVHADAIAFGSIPFTDSFLLEFKITENSAGTVEIGTRARYHITG